MRKNFNKRLVTFAMAVGIAIPPAPAIQSANAANAPAPVSPAAMPDIAKACVLSAKLDNQIGCTGAVLQELAQSVKDIASIQAALPESERPDLTKYEQQDDNCTAAETEMAILRAFYTVASKANMAGLSLENLGGPLKAATQTRAACLQGMSAYLKTRHPDGADLVSAIGQRLNTVAGKIGVPAAMP